MDKNQESIKSIAPNSILTLLKICVIGWAVLALFAHMNIGLADNGDFGRSIRLFSDGPAASHVQLTVPQFKDWADGLEIYWLPYWNLKWEKSAFETSTLFLWLPGIFLNVLCFSKKILYLPFISLVPRCFLLFFLLALVNWIERKFFLSRILLLVTMGIPMTLCLSDINYQAFFNSFFQETGEFIYLLLFGLSIVLLLEQPVSRSRLVFSLFALSLLGISKLSLLYVFPIGLLLLALISDLPISRKWAASISLFTGLAVMAGLLSYYHWEQPDRMRNHAYQRVFFGSLTFSRDVDLHLAQLGWLDAKDCINHDAFDEIGHACLEKFADQLSLQTSLRIFMREPSVFLRSVNFMTRAMQEIDVSYLSKYSVDNPLVEGDVGEKTNDLVSPFALWSALKRHFFPRGATLILVLLLCFIVCLIHSDTPEPIGAMSVIGVILVIFCVADILVAILADGKADTVKHLFFANVCFDLALIFSVNIILLRILSSERLAALISLCRHNARSHRT